MALSSDILANGGCWGDAHKLNLTWILEQMQAATEAVKQSEKEIAEYKEKMDAEFKKLRDTQCEQFGILKEDWNTQLEWLINSIIPQLVRFTISTEGRLEAWIPEQWEKLDFFTDVSNPNSCAFGRLQLKYDGMWRPLVKKPQKPCRPMPPCTPKPIPPCEYPVWGCK